VGAPAGSRPQVRRYLKTIDPAAEIPPAGIWPSASPRPQPYIWAEADIGRLLAAARALRPPLRHPLSQKREERWEETT
jgi:hypothetical protein